MKRLGQKFGKTPAQMVIAWVLANPGIIFALTGPSTIAHLEENLGGSGKRKSAAALAEFQAFLDQEASRLVQEQRESIRSILNGPDTSATFVDLLYVIETVVQLKFLSENDGMQLTQKIIHLA